MKDERVYFTDDELATFNTFVDGVNYIIEGQKFVFAEATNKGVYLNRIKPTKEGDYSA